MYRLGPTGEHLVEVCTNLACMLRGAEDGLRGRASRRPASRRARSSRPTASISVHEEECLGVCDFAPAVQVDFCNHDAVSPERMRELIGELRAGDVPAPARGPAFASFRRASRALAGLEEVSVA